MEFFMVLWTGLIEMELETSLRDYEVMSRSRLSLISWHGIALALALSASAERYGCFREMIYNHPLWRLSVVSLLFFTLAALILGVLARNYSNCWAALLFFILRCWGQKEDENDGENGWTEMGTIETV
jgi:hypothetical protein